MRDPIANPVRKKLNTGTGHLIGNSWLLKSSTGIKAEAQLNLQHGEAGLKDTGCVLCEL